MLLSDSPEPPFYTFRLDCHHCHTCQYRDFDLEQDWRSCDEFDPVRGKTKSAMRGMFFGKDCICFSRSIYSVRLIYWGVSWLQANRRGGGTQNDHIKKTVVWKRKMCQDTTCSQWVSQCAPFQPFFEGRLPSLTNMTDAPSGNQNILPFGTTVNGKSDKRDKEEQITN